MGVRTGNSHAHIPRKRFGQHFLTDQAIIEAIVNAIAPKAGQWMVEIGPGLAALTQPLLERLGHLVVIELDRDLASRLRLRPGLEVIEADVLAVDFAALASGEDQHAVHKETPGRPEFPCSPTGGRAPQGGLGRAVKLRVVGNLPYNISTPILFHLLGFAGLILDQHFMLQKEVVDRMVASPSTAAYGRLSVMLQWRYAMENILAVPPSSFDPPPRVHSAVVRMLPKQDVAQVDVGRLSEIVRVAFGQRRKLLRHSLGRWLTDHAFAGNFDLQRRAEEVRVEEYVALAQNT